MLGLASAGHLPGMLATIPAWLRLFIWICLAIILLILVGLVVHALGGGLLELHAGHFLFELGAT